jgi:hypothetical protein
MPYADRDAFLAAIARDLGDPDGGIWTEDDLNRHLDHALADLADAAGAEDSLDITADGSTIYDIREYTDIHTLLAVEWPVGKQPPAYLRFHEWAGRVMLHDAVPPAGDTVRIHFRKPFTVDEEGSDVPAELEELAVMGAWGYATRQLAARTTGTVNVDRWVSRRYERQAERTLALFRRSLAEKTQAREDPPFRGGETPAWYSEI